MLQDNCKIGQKGFGFIPNNENIKFPHIGCVMIEDNVEIASGYLIVALLIILQLVKILT